MVSKRNVNTQIDEKARKKVETNPCKKSVIYKAGK
jgi:hypothetical protein